MQNYYTALVLVRFQSYVWIVFRPLTYTIKISCRNQLSENEYGLFVKCFLLARSATRDLRMFKDSTGDRRLNESDFIKKDHSGVVKLFLLISLSLMC